MKNVILTHNELQNNIFVAVADGFVNGATVPKGYFLTYRTDGKAEYTLELWKAASKPELGDGQQMYVHGINKGDYQMNDIRLGVTIAYLRENAKKFLKNVGEIIDNIKENKSIQEEFTGNPSKDIFKMQTQHAPDASEDEQFSVFITDSDPNNAFVAGYGSNFQEAMINFIKDVDDHGYFLNANLDVVAKTKG